MKLVTYDPGDGAGPRPGALLGETHIVDLPAASRSLEEPRRVPMSLLELLQGDSALLDAAGASVDRARSRLDAGDVVGPDGVPIIHDRGTARLLSPLPRPTRIRDYLTYEEHAAGSGMRVPRAFTEMPICYKGNPLSVIGPDEDIVWPAFTQQLDFELELALVTGKAGRNIPASRGVEHLVGVTIFNDVSARDIQFREMTLQLGPSKGKDFCNVLGPCVLTMDEVADEEALVMRAMVNGETWAEGTSGNRRYSFSEVVAWASYCEDLHPGEVIGLGTVGRGCGLELDRWIQPGDLIELEIDGLGVLRNRVGSPEAPSTEAGLPSYRIPRRASSG